MARGRKRKMGKREPSGRISRAAKPALNEHSLGIESRMRLFGLSRDQAMDQRAATAIGRARLRREISEAQYLAAANYLALYGEYKRAVKAPDAERSGEPVGAPAPETEAYADWCKDVIAAWDAVCGKLQEGNDRLRGTVLYAAVQYVVVRDVELPPLLGDLRCALSVLVEHFGLTESGDLAA